MANQIKKSNEDDNIIIAWIKDLDRFFRVKLKFNFVQSYGYIFLIIAIPISILFGFTGQQCLSFKIIFIITTILLILLTIYSIKNFKKVNKLEAKINSFDFNSIKTVEDIDNFKGDRGLLFEKFVEIMLKSQGYIVTGTQHSHDNSVDFKATDPKRNIAYAVQVKQRTNKNINRNMLVDLKEFGKQKYKTEYAWIITNQRLTASASEYQLMYKEVIKVTDRDDIDKYIRENRAKS
jgi:hypothetical protein